MIFLRLDKHTHILWNPNFITAFARAHRLFLFRVTSLHLTTSVVFELQFCVTPPAPSTPLKKPQIQLNTKALSCVCVMSVATEDESVTLILVYLTCGSVEGTDNRTSWTSDQCTFQLLRKRPDRTAPAKTSRAVQCS